MELKYFIFKKKMHTRINELSSLSLTVKWVNKMNLAESIL